MTRQEATQALRDELIKHKLTDWGVRLNQNANSAFLGLCSYKDKCIILSAHHIDIHPTPDVLNTIRHEVAHAIVGPGHAHNEVWAAKAREIGCDNTLPCSNLSLSPEIIDAIRSGADVEVTFDEHVIRVPKYNITRLQDKCEYCGKVAKSVSETLVPISNENEPDLKIIRLECGHTLVRKLPKGTPFHSFQFGGDPKCDHNWEKNKCLNCGRNRPYDFQIEGMRFLEAGLSVNKGACCFDDMGLGKTIQAGGVIKFHPEWWPTLWIVKSGLKFQTSSFIINWLGDEHVPQVVNTSQDWLIPGLKHYIIGYDMLVPKSRTIKGKNGAPDKVINSGFDISQFDRIGIKLVVLDECQQVKNVDSSRTQMVRRVVRDRKVLPLSGTPWNNRGNELYPVCNMVAPMKFPSDAAFDRDWVEKYWVGSTEKKGGIKHIARFKEYTKDIIIRRERRDVLPELPLTNRTKLNIVMTKQEAEAYDAAVDEFVAWYEAQMDNLGGMAIIAAMAKMRHLVALAKMPATLEYVREFAEDTDRKLIVFAHHKDVQAMLYDSMKAEYEDNAEAEDKIPVFRITAEMDPSERYDTQVAFNKATRAFMVASQKAAGEGLNLQTCNIVYMHERQWNPGSEQQCEDRVARIGQEASSIDAIYAHMTGLTSIDPALDAIVERKRRQYSNWTGGEAPAWNQDEIMKELADVIVSTRKRQKKAA